MLAEHSIDVMLTAPDLEPSGHSSLSSGTRVSSNNLRSGVGLGLHCPAGRRTAD
jgi:hypothetical protein